MFTGIIEQLGTIQAIHNDQDNKLFTIKSNLTPELKIDQSLAHNGVCLTITHIDLATHTHTVCAVPETLAKTTLQNWNPGDTINLERCMQLNGRIDGHIVQGHVDTTAHCEMRQNNNNNWLFRFSIPNQFAPLIIEKGSITVDGISLTCFNVTDHSFDVTIIPYTFEHTAIHNIQPGQQVNIEFDILGKYITRLQSLQHLNNA